MFSANDFEVFVPGRPIGKGRPRIGKNGVYTPEKTTKAEEYIADAWRLRFGDTPPDTRNAAIAVMAFKHASKAHSSDIGQPWGIKPDADNILKLVMDALNGVAWKDDAQVVRAWVEKTAYVKTEEEEGLLIAVSFDDGKKED